MSGERYSVPASSGQSGWLAPRSAGALAARLAVPGSKSLTNRELILAAIADAPSTIQAPLHSDDSVRMVAALTALGVQIDPVEGDSPFGPDLVVTPPGGSGSVGASSSGLHGATVDCGQAGTVMRFIAGIAGLADGDVTLTAHESALHRPMGAMITALRDVGVDVDDEGRWALPFQVRGRGHIRGGEVVIDASASSQFVSGMLLAAPRFDTGLHLIHSGSRLPSLPHIDMTIECLAHRGVHVERPSPREWIVPPQPPRGKTVAIEPDLSNAAPFLAAAMVTGGTVTITGWPAHSTQPGVMLATILHDMGARVTRRGGALTVAAGRGTIVGLAAFAAEPTTITGVGHIRGHETDRIAALVGNLRALGGGAEELEDGIRVLPQPLHGGVWRAFHDHRIATTGALIGLAVEGVFVDDIGTTAKTMPQFPDLWATMLEGNDAE